MYRLLVLISVLYLVGCGKEPIQIPDYCPDCSLSVEINGDEWSGDVKSSDFYTKYDSSKMVFDTFFRIILEEINPKHDKFKDGLSITDIPYRTGQYSFDSTLLSLPKHVNAEFMVYEVEYDVPLNTYHMIYDGESYLNIDSLDKQTRRFKATFSLNMSIYWGGVGTLFNTTYPPFISFTDGQIEGVIIAD